jgi:hypothetical protein
VRRLLSFDGGGIAGTIGFDDEDVRELDPAAMGWTDMGHPPVPLR